jgi:hypothetical protein
MATNNNINYGPAALPGTISTPVLGNNIDRAPAPVAPGPGTGYVPTVSRPVVPVTEQPVINPPITVARTAVVIPVAEQPVATVVAESTTGSNITASNQQRYLTILANGAVITSDASSLDFEGNGFTITSSGVNGAVITLSGAAGYGNSNVATFLAAFGSNTLSTTGNVTAGYILGNGSQLTGLAATYGNANVVANLAALGSNPVSTTGNITSNFFIGNGSQLTGLAATYGNANVAANLAAFGSNPVSTSGNITGGNILGGANVNATTHTGTTVSVSANITGGNILTAGVVSATGNISGNYFIGNGSQLTGTANTGNVTFSSEAVIGTGTSNTVSGLYLAPDPGSLANSLYLRVRGNVIDEPTHIHFDTGNNQYYNQFIGDDNKYIQLANTGNIVINSNDIAGNSAQWIFGSNSKITLPNGATIRDTSGDSVVFGQNAGLTSQAQHAVAIGINAGRLYQGEDSVAIGYNAGYYDQGRGVAIGWNAGEGGVLFRSVSDAQGGSGPVHNYVSGNGNPTLTLDSVVNVTVNDLVFGNNIPAGAYVVSINAPDINISAPPTAALTAGDDITFVGLDLGINDASNIVLYMRVIGTDIPENTFVQSTGCSTVTLNNTPTAPLVNGASITFNVGQGFGATAVGYRAGENFQDANAVAVGSQAGYDNQGVAAVAIGYLAGYANQGNAAVAMGWSAGQTTQGTAAVAIGEDAGRTSQGEYSVAIGYQAGYSGQGNNSIVLNATGDQINGITANTFTVTPVRNDVANTANVMFYNASSKEITYGDVISVAGNITGGNVLFGSGIVSGTGNITGGNLTISGNTATITTANYSIGYLNVPQVSLAANATIALTDSGKHYYSVSASNLALTIANNTSVSWSVGTAITIVNAGTANILINQGTGVSMYQAGNATSGNRVLATFGMATIMNTAANVWFINGTGLT